MVGTDFSNPFDPPTDPAFIRFRDGLQGHLAGGDAPERLRWHPQDGKWYSYPLNSYALVEIGVPATRAPREFNLEHLGGLTFESVPKMPSSFELPQLFQDVTAAYGKISAKWPNVVWSARTGEWRNAIRGNSVPAGPGDTDSLPPQAHKRIAGVREAEKFGYISRDDAAKLIVSIIAEYT